LTADRGSHSITLAMSRVSRGEPNDGYWVLAINSYGATEGTRQTFATPSEAKR
jgi:hypothetical protein